MDLTVLSWALYLIDVIGHVDTAFAFIGVIGSIVFLICLFMRIVMFSEVEEEVKNETDEDHVPLHKRQEYRTVVNIMKWVNWAPFIFILWLLIPGSETMNRILAVETANYVAQTEEAQQLKEKLMLKINNLLEKE